MTREQLYSECVQYVSSLLSNYSIPTTPPANKQEEMNHSVVLEIRHACRFVLGKDCCGKKDHEEAQGRLGIGRCIPPGVDPATLRKILGDF